MSTERRAREPRLRQAGLRREPAGDGLFIVGIVGRAGSGKSTVARQLVADGAVVIDADALGHEIADRDPRVRSALIAEYGSAVYGANGLDRRRVAEVVFRDRAARERLNRVVHPRILERIAARLEGLREIGFRGIVVVDAALMLDWGLERWCDAVIAVTAPEAERVERLMRARGWSRAETERRLAIQRPAEAFAEAADLVLDNRGRPEDLEREALEGVRALRRRRRTPTKGTGI
jgi:dephospho-CoA kinase